MSQDLKCALGVHRFELLQQEKVVEHNDEKDDKGMKGVNSVIGIQMICRCSNCGKIKSWFVPTDKNYINRSVRA